MSNQYLKVNIDYMAILKALEFATNLRWEQYGKCLTMSPATSISEWRSIGLMIGRQCGATMAMVEWIKQHDTDSCVVIHKDRHMSNAFRTNFQESETMFESFNVADLRNSINHFFASTVEDAYDNIAQRIKASRPKYIIFDDSSVCFSYFGIKRKDFNTWVHAIAGPEVLVIHIK